MRNKNLFRRKTRRFRDLFDWLTRFSILIFHLRTYKYFKRNGTSRKPQAFQLKLNKMFIQICTVFTGDAISNDFDVFFL